jgi:hypothetical protein
MFLDVAFAFAFAIRALIRWGNKRQANWGRVA